MSLKEKRIGVVMGGVSSEREISIKSGTAVLDALRGAGFDAVGLDVLAETHDEITRLVSSNAIDIVFVVMHGGFGEDGRLQHILEKNRISFTGPCEAASRLAMDKAVSRMLFKKAGLIVPKYILFKKGSSGTLQKIGLPDFRCPLVVKPLSQGSSIGISFIDSFEELDSALAYAFKYEDAALVEEFITGREITVSVLDGRALPVVEIVPKKKFFDFQAKYEKGLTDYIVPAVLDDNVRLRAQEDAVIAYNALGCRHLSRVDMIINANDEPVILEVNTIPGMTQTSLFPKAAAAAGINFSKLCTILLELANGQA